MNRVEVEWIDSAATHGWHQSTDKPEREPLVCWSLGFLMEKTETRITIAQNRNEDGGTGEWITIPIACVKKVRRLK